MVFPSDMAPALTALNAKLEIGTPKGNKLIPFEQFYVRPGKNILKETILGPAEMVLAVEIPAPAPGSKSIYLKLKERQAFDFAIASVAATVTFRNNIVSDARIVLGGVAPYPFRAIEAEGVLKGKKIGDAVGAATKAAVDGFQVLSNNGYKVKATKGIIEQALVMLA